MTLKYVITETKPYAIKLYDNDTLIMDQPFYPSGDLFKTYEEARSWAIYQLNHMQDAIANPMPPISPTAQPTYIQEPVFEADIEIDSKLREQMVDTNGVDTTSSYLEQIGFFNT